MKINRHNIVLPFVLLLLFVDGKAFTQTDLSKRLSLNIKNVELISALTILEKEADVKFAYSAESLPGHKRLTLTYSEVPLSVILDDISEKNDLKYEVTGQLIVISRNLAKQQRTVSGTVTTETGEPLAGVSVNIKGTKL